MTSEMKIENGNKVWRNEHGKRHRTDGPAVEWADGDKAWYLNGKLHRTDGPAVEGADGGKWWYLNGKRHRADGPAIERADGYKEWWVNGKELTEAEFNRMEKMTRQPLTADRQKALDIIDRLRGKVRVPIADGLGKVTPDGNDDFFERTFPTSKLANEAADFIKAALTTPAPQSCDCDAPTNAPEVLTVDQLTQIIQLWAFTDLGPYEKFGEYIYKKYPNGIKIIKGEAK